MLPIAHIEKSCWLRLPMVKKIRCSAKQELENEAGGYYRHGYCW